MKVGTLVVLLPLVCAPAWGAEAGSPIRKAAPNPAIARIVSEISPQRIEANIRKLASFGTRNSLSDDASETRGIGAARRWIKAQLDACAQQSMGRLKVELDSFIAQPNRRIPQPTELVNVVATLPGEQPESAARVYVVSGHYDSMPSNVADPTTDAPGANDDASGTAAVIRCRAKVCSVSVRSSSARR